MNRRTFSILVLLLGLSMGAATYAATQTQVQLLLSAQAARPGDTVWAGFKMEMPEGWHTYWRFGGDAGEPTHIKWTLPSGVTAGPIQWPVPEKMVDTYGDTSLYTYAYTNQVILLVAITLDKSLRLGPLTLQASGAWMECASICVMGHGDASATLTVGDEARPSSDAPLLDQWRKKLALADSSIQPTAYWETASAQSNSRPLIIEWKTNAAPADFYPYGSTNFDLGGKTETLTASADTIRLRKIVSKHDADWPTEIDGLMAGKIGSPERFGVETRLSLDAKAATTVAAPIVKATTAPASLVVMLFFAFLGGLILNVMPCVLPVIALKILGFVNQSKEEPGRVRKLGAVYGLGVLLSFVVLAGLAIGVQRAGGNANWGDAFRNPQFQVVLTALMMLIALNLFGVFEITLSGKALGAASELSGRQGYGGAFFNGILATVLAIPCTAPFLGVALAFAFTQPPSITLLVFLAAGLGLAFPFVLLCWNPKLLKLLPKPGPWMQKFKVAMGFPMLATAVWLMWVSSSHEDDELWLGLFLVVLALAAWVWGEFVQRSSRGKLAAVIVCLVLLVADYEVILEGQLQWRSSGKAGAGVQAGIDWKVWSPEAVEQARRDGHPVLVDFTAKSCLSCKLNQASSLDIDRTRAKLRQTGTVAFKADFTHEDPAIAEELHRFNRPGVPLVLVFAKNTAEAPEVLPPLLTPTIVLNALDQAAR
jgi:thiol:disulfide interchange protein